MTLTFLHTSPLHIKTFNDLLERSGARPNVNHLLHEALLDEAKAARTVTDRVAAKLEAVIKEAAATSAVILCTCSTLGGVAEGLAETYNMAILRVDRPMAEQAVRQGKKIAVVAALASTLEPTRLLLEEAARLANKEVEIRLSVCEGAWAEFEAGDVAAYHASIARHLTELAADADVIVLAQASMMGAVALVNVAPPVLSSPELGLAAALELYNKVVTANA